MKNLLLILFSLIVLGLGSCEEEKAPADVKAKTYTCPMHPQVIRKEPGTCPICGMDLVVFDRNNPDEYLTLNESQQALANIRIELVGGTAFQGQKQLNGRLAVNPEATISVSAKVTGRVERLYVAETGVTVAKDQPLFAIYSEQLAALQQEYLVAAAQVREFPNDKKFGEIKTAAKQRLQLYGQTAAQIESLEKNGTTSPTVAYSSPASGTISSISVAQGDYVSEGSPVLQIENYNSLWVEADLYPDAAAQIKNGQTVRVVIPGYENEPQNVRLNFIAPALQQGKQLLTVRGEVRNQNNRWQAGQQAIIFLPSSAPSTSSSLPSVPAAAVIRDAEGAHIWKAEGQGRFKATEIEIEEENAEWIKVKNGIEPGDSIVVSGAYLLYSEYILKKGRNPVATHQH